MLSKILEKRVIDGGLLEAARKRSSGRASSQVLGAEAQPEERPTSVVGHFHPPLLTPELAAEIAQHLARRSDGFAAGRSQVGAVNRHRPAIGLAAVVDPEVVARHRTGRPQAWLSLHSHAAND